jgi:hypothetical protein
MNAASSRWRRLAVKLAQHAAWILPGAGSPWADAMRHELDYIDDDPAALRWALGCILASYRARLAERPSFSGRVAWRYVATSGVLMLLIGLALDENAGGQPAPPRPAFDETRCDLRDPSPGIRAGLQCGTVSAPVSHDDAMHGPCAAGKAADLIGPPTPAPDKSCDQVAPIPSSRTSGYRDDDERVH